MPRWKVKVRNGVPVRGPGDFPGANEEIAIHGVIARISKHSDASKEGTGPFYIITDLNGKRFEVMGNQVDVTQRPTLAEIE